MELYLILPVPPGTPHEPHDEDIHQKTYRLTGPHPFTPGSPLNPKFHCVSYVWGPRVEGKESFFGCKREISDRTRPALEAAIRAVSAIYEDRDGDKEGEEVVEAFWIDALCIPQLESRERYRTLENMGFIYNIATYVLVVLNSTVFSIIASASTSPSPSPLSLPEMEDLEKDRWISRVWTYQELVNSHEIFFSAISSPSPPPSPPLSVTKRERPYMNGSPFFSLIGTSLSSYKTLTNTGELSIMRKFPNLSALCDALVDRLMAAYLDRSIFCVLSNMEMRQFDAKFPENRLLACLGAVTKDAVWSEGGEEKGGKAFEGLVGRLMAVCEGKGDYSFLYTRDERCEVEGMRWRPDPIQRRKLYEEEREGGKPRNLVPVVSWNSTGIQGGHTDERGFWLERMIKLIGVEKLSPFVEEEFKKILYGYPAVREPGATRGGLLRGQVSIDEGLDLATAVLSFVRKIGFTGDSEPWVCENGLFFSQLPLKDHEEPERFAAADIIWNFGSPGLVKWKQNGEVRYCAGIFVGIVRGGVAENILMN